jgi:hypothetical protein
MHTHCCTIESIEGEYLFISFKSKHLFSSHLVELIDSHQCEIIFKIGNEDRKKRISLTTYLGYGLLSIKMPPR